MLLARFNSLGEQDAAEFLRPFLDVPRWGEEILRARPFPTKDALVAHARTAAQPLGPDEVARAMSHHPRIGERPSGASAEAEHSRAEQAAIDPTDAALAGALSAGNRAYEDRFGRVFLVRAAGRSPAEILDQLQERLGNDPDTEDDVVARELRDIAVLRLEGAVSA